MYAFEFETDFANPDNVLKNFEQFKNQRIKVIVLAEKEPQKTAPSAHYDFSDLSGKLNWSGDALAEQKALRDEW